MNNLFQYFCAGPTNNINSINTISDINLANLLSKIDINETDSKGNTLFHYAFRTNNNIDMLLENGANPFIYNHKKLNGLTFTREKIPVFWNKFKNLELNETFKENTLGYHSELKQSIFNTLSTKEYFLSPSEFIHFLEQNNLYTIDNYGKMLVYESSLPMAILVFSETTRTPENNTIFVNNILKNMKEDLKTVSHSKIFHNFLDNPQFSLNYDFLRTVLGFNFSMSFPKDSPPINLVNKLLKIIANGPVENMYKMERNIEGEPIKVSYNDCFSHAENLKSMYLAHRMEKILPLKSTIYKIMKI